MLKNFPIKLSKKGFTLLEILIVLVILGVIAGLAIPAYQSSVEKSRSQEALQTLGAIRESMIRYFALNNAYTNATLCGGGVNDLDYCPTTNAGGQTVHFTYLITAQAQPTFTLTATRNGVDGGDNASTLTLQQSGVIGKTGVFAA